MAVRTDEEEAPGHGRDKRHNQKICHSVRRECKSEFRDQIQSLRFQPKL